MKALATAALAAIVLMFSIGVPAADKPLPKAAKPSSFAPRNTGQRVFGAPIQPPIVGPRNGAHHKAKATAKKSSTPKKTKKPAAPKPAQAAAKG
jgi:hypothetical protein